MQARVVTYETHVAGIGSAKRPIGKLPTKARLEIELFGLSRTGDVKNRDRLLEH